MSREQKSSRVGVVTGGSGFIGTHLLRRLLANNAYDRIHVLDLVAPQIGDPRVSFHQCDIRQPITVRLDCTDASCFHLAAICKEPGFPWDEYFETNHQGTRHVCDFASRSGISNMIYTSTDMVYRAGEEQMFEHSPTCPDTAYGISKLLGELEISGWAQANLSRRHRIVRPGVVFGAGENGNYTRLLHALRRNLFFYIGRKTTIKSSIYVKDCTRFLELMAGDEGQRTVFNLAYPEPTSIGEICKAMGDVFGFRTRIPTLPYGFALVASYVFEGLSRMRILNTAIHHRRIQKLYYSTHMNCDSLKDSCFTPHYPLRQALEDWQRDCGRNDLR